MRKRIVAINNTGIFVTVLLLFIMLIIPITPVYSKEEPEAVYFGLENSHVLLYNIDFTDVRSSGAWSKEAICEMGALEIVKGYGNRVFGRTNNVTREEAIAIIYRAAGREEDAQRAAEALDALRNSDEKKTYAPSMWSDGYLQLAASEGLISAQDLSYALVPQQDGLQEGSFNRRAPAQRQEVAYWISLVLGLEPVYGQQEIFNSFRDWSAADPHKIPYIEAVLVNNIMNGEGNGYFRPTGNVTREQIAQIIKNADSWILPLLGYEKKIGTVEGIKKSVDFTGGFGEYSNTFNVRNSNGRLHEIMVRYTDNSSGYKNELGGQKIGQPEMDLIVYKNGWVGDGSLLQEDDRIEYIASADNRVRYVSVISNASDTQYFAAKIREILPGTNAIRVTKLFDMEYPDVDTENIDFSMDKEREEVETTYVCSNAISVSVNGIKADIADIAPGTDAVLSVRNNVVTAINTINLSLRDKGVVSGVVEDNNPQLGYITLYNEKFPREGVAKNGNDRVKTYNYSNPKNITVYKNHKEATLEDIENGDSAYIKLDENGVIEIISAVDNYVEKFGKIISKKSGIINVAYDDGTQQIIYLDDSIPVEIDRKLVNSYSIKDGDRVKLLLNITNNVMNVKKITIEGDEHFIANIYKGFVTDLDIVSNMVILRNMEVLNNGKWNRIEQKGFTTLRLSEDNEFIYNNRNVDADSVKKQLRDTPAYIAVEKDYGGEEKAVLISFKNTNDSEAPVFTDSITSHIAGNEGEITLKNEYRNIAYNNGTIIVKDNRLVTGNSISIEDEAFVVANRSYNDSAYYASVVQIKERVYPDFFKIYRGRIAGIDENSNFTVESFSELNGLKWNYYNTPKTFTLTYETRIVDDEGVVGQRDFTDYGDKSFKGRTVYIVTNSSDAVLINTAPYGNINVKGEIYEIVVEDTSDTAQQNSEGLGNQRPTAVKLLNVKEYDSQANMWVNRNETMLGILENSIVIKGNSIVNPAVLKKGDSIRVIKNDSSGTGDAYIIFVE